MIQKPLLTDKQKVSFQKKFREIVANPEANEAILHWDGTISWDLADMPHMPGFRREKLRGKLASDYHSLMVRLSNGII
jgi:hypothetical protein